MKIISIISISVIALTGCKVNVDVGDGGDVYIPNEELCKSGSVCAVELPKEGAWLYPTSVQDGFFFTRWEGCNKQVAVECFVTPSDTKVKYIKASFSQDITVSQSSLASAIINNCHSNYERISSNTKIKDIHNLTCDYTLTDELLSNISISLPMLEELAIYLGDVSSVEPLSKLPYLRWLYLAQNETSLTDLSPLKSLSSLETVELWTNTKIPCSQISDLDDELKTHNPAGHVVEHDKIKCLK